MIRVLRADAERSVRSIVEAAERVLADDPAASLERIAQEAGVARTTVHRRFASRQALLDALVVIAAEELRGAVEDARSQVVPPLVALHQIAANVLRTGISWRFALTAAEPGSAAARRQEQVERRCRDLLRRARDEGVLDSGADLEWTRRVYFALIGEALRDKDTDPDVLADRVVETLLNGLGPRTRDAGRD
jgi:AcrR family transcriptional regulator